MRKHKETVFFGLSARQFFCALLAVGLAAGVYLGLDVVLGKEQASQLAARQLKFIQHLQAALVRIENGTYGICRETGKLIPKERLRAVPHATLSIDAKMAKK